MRRTITLHAFTILAALVLSAAWLTAQEPSGASREATVKAAQSPKDESAKKAPPSVNDQSERSVKSAPESVEGAPPHSQSPSGAANLPGSPGAPDVYLLPDSDGKLRRVLGYRYEDFAEARKQRLGAGDSAAQPRYSIQNVKVDGAEKDDHAELAVDITIRLNVDQWVEIPLNLSDAVLIERPTASKKADFFLSSGVEGAGYSLWLRGQTGSENRFTLSMLAPVKTEGSDRVFRLSLPRATTSEVTFNVLAAGAVATVSDGAMLVSAKPNESGGTRVVARAAGAPLVVRWRTPGSDPSADEVVLQSNAEIVTLIEGSDIQAEAILTLQSLGAPLERLRVELPRGAELAPSSTDQYGVQPLSTQDKSENLVEVTLKKKTRGPVTVRLKTRLKPDAMGEGETIDLAGFRVLEAIEESGHLAVRVQGDWSVLWPSSDRARGNVRRIEVSDLPESLRGESPQFAFQYFRQPFSLPAEVIAHRPHRRIDSEYLVRIGADRSDLQGDLRFQVTGSAIFDLEIDMPGWIVDQIGPPTVVEEFVRDPDGHRVHVRLRQAARGEIPITLKAHRAHTFTMASTTALDGSSEASLESEDPSMPTELSGEGPAETTAPEPSSGSVSAPTAQTLVRLSLPTPVVDAQTPGVVLIVPESNVVLSPEVELMQGLTPQLVQPRRIAIPAQRQEPLAYRVDVPPAVFAAKLRIQPRKIRVSTLARITFEPELARTIQSVRYDVDFEPIDRLAFHLPAQLAGDDRVEVIYNGERLPIVLREAETDKDDGVSATVTLPGARIGSFQLQFRYATGIGFVSAQQPIPVAIPFILPTDGTLTECEAEISPNSGQQVTLSTDKEQTAWSLVASKSETAAANRPLRVRAASPQRLLPLRVQRIQPVFPSVVFVDRYWIQSRIAASRRQDRVVMRLTTPRPEVVVELPPRVAVERLAVLLDGRPLDNSQVVVDSENPSNLTVPIPAGSANHQLELRYELVGANPSRLMPVRLRDESILTHVYWQIVLPPHVHLLNASDAYAGENNWQFSGLGWSRRPVLDVRWLENWSGAKGSAPLPAHANVYLFSRGGTLESLEIQATSRSTIVLAVSGVTLLLGFLFVYVPAIRKSWIVLPLLVMLVVIAILMPDPAILFGQAAALGVLLVLLTVALRAVLARRPSRAVLVSGPSSLIIPSERTVTYQEPVSEAPSSTTATVTSPTGSSG